MKSWDEKWLLKKKNYLLKRLGNTKNDDIKFKIVQMIGCLDDALNYISDPDSIIKYPSILNGLGEDKVFHDEFKTYLGDIADFYTGFYFNMPEEPLELDTINTSSSKILSVSREFYKEIKPCFADRLSNNIMNCNLRVRFENGNNDSYYTGQTFPIFDTDLCLVSVNLNNKSTDYFNLIHEYGHVLNHSFDRYQMFDFDKYPLQEVTSLFFELVAGDYLIDNGLDKRDITRNFIHIFRDGVSAAGINVFRSELIRNINLFDNDEDVIKYLDNNFFDKDLIEFSKDNLMRESMNYVFSYIIAVELYMKYLKDKDEALNLLVRIMKISNLNAEDYYNYITSIGITPLYNMSEYLDSLKGKQLKYGK